MGHAKRKKTVLYLGGALLVSLCLVYGAYQFTINRFQREIDGFLEALVSEDIMRELENTEDYPELEKPLETGEEVPRYVEESKEQKEKVRAEDQKDPPAPQQGAEKPIDQPAPQQPETPTPPQPDRKEETGEDGPPPPLPDDPKPEPPEEEPREQHAIFGNMPLKQQVYILGKINRFSLTELKELYQLYTQGAEAWGDLKNRLLERLTEEEIQRLKALYLEYM